MTAEFAGSVTGGAGLSVDAAGTNTAKVSSTPVAVGLFAGSGASVLAEVTKAAQVTATVLAGSSLDLGTASARVSATLVDAVNASVNGGGGGGISVSDLRADANDAGGSAATFGGAMLSGTSLVVSADATHAASADIYVLSIGVVGVGLSEADAEIGTNAAEAVDSAVILGSARISSPGTAVTVVVTRGALAASSSSGGAGGFVGSAGLTANASTRGMADAHVADGAAVGNSTGRPASLSVAATDASVAVANSSVGSGGFVANGLTRTSSTSAPSVQAYLGRNVSVSLGDQLVNGLTVKALSQRAEADASSSNSGGGAAAVGVSYATANSAPVVRAYLDAGTTVQAGGSVSVTAVSDSIAAPGTALDDFIAGFTAHGGPVPDDVVVFPVHGLSSGDEVLYDANGNTVIGGLRSGHLYRVLVADDNTLRLGATFSGAEVDATTLQVGASGVDADRRMIRFSGPHHFETGDAVVYRTDGSSIGAGFGNGAVLYVRVIDSQTIQLFSTYADATAPALALEGIVAGGQVSTTRFAEGDLVTYTVPEPLAFRANSVDVNTSGTGIDTNNPDNPAADNIYLGHTETVDGSGQPIVNGHGLSNGQKIVYESGGTVIGGLVAGGVYYVHRVDAFTIQLASSYCAAVGWDADHSCTSGVDGNGDPIKIAVATLAISRPAGDPNSSVPQAISPAPVAGLADGGTYQVHRVDAGHITLRPPGSVTDIALDATHVLGDFWGQHTLSAAGVVLATASGTQQLYLRLTGGFDTSHNGGQKLLASDGTSLRVASPPPGDGQSSSSARGGGGGGLDIRRPTAMTNVNPTAKAFIAASSVMAGGDVTVTAAVTTHASGATSNGSGGAISVAEVQTNITGTNHTLAYIGTGPDSISGDSGGVQVNGSGVTIAAGGNVRVGAATNLSTTADASSNSGGLIGVGTATADTNLTDNTAVVVGANAHVTGATVALLSQTSSNGSVNPHITTGGLFGSATSNANYALTSTVVALLDGDSMSRGSVTGRYGVDVRAISHDNRASRNPDATCYCIGPSHENSNGQLNLTDLVLAHQGMTVYAGPRLAGGPLVVVPSRSFLVLYVQAEEYSNDGDNFARAIHWNSDVVANAGASPSLVVGSDGRVISAVNVTVNGVTNPAPGSTVGSLTSDLVVQDLRNTGSADIWMTSNQGTIDGGSCVGGADGDACRLGIAAGTHYWGTFTFDMSWASVLVLNQSARNLVINDIDPISRTAVPTVTLNSPNGGSSTTHFAIRDTVGSTVITITNTDPSGPDLLINGTIENPVGQTRVTSLYGPISSSSTRGGASSYDGTHTSLIRSNVVHLVAGTSMGSGPLYLHLDLVAWHDHAVVLDATAGSDAYLDLLTRLRDHNVVDPALTPGAAYTVDIGDLVAGDSLNLLLQRGVYETGSGTAGFVFVSSTGPSPTANFYNFYYPDIPFTRSDNEGAYAAKGHGINTTYAFSRLESGTVVPTGSITVDAANPSDITDTHRVNIVANSDVHLTGNIDMHTSGYITDTELVGDLRVGEIKSFDDNVRLTGPASIVDAPTGSADPPTTGDDAADVIGVNLVLTAGTAGPGSIGSNTNFLEVDSGYDRFGLVTARARGVIRITEVRSTAPPPPAAPHGVASPLRSVGLLALTAAVPAGPSDDIYLDVVDSCYFDVACDDVTIRAENGSILDGHNAGTGGTIANIIGNSVDLVAIGGTIGRFTAAATGVYRGDVKVDSAKGTGCQSHSSLAWLGATEAQRAVTAGCTLAFAGQSVHVTELDGSANVLLAFATDGDLRLTTTETAQEGNDIQLVHDGTIVFDESGPSFLTQGYAASLSGNVLLLSADNVVSDPTFAILASTAAGDSPVTQPNPNLPKTATGNVDIFGDWHPGIADATAHDGTVIVLRGSVTNGDQGLTRVFGNADDDLVVFDQTLLVGQTRAFGSANPPTVKAYSPAADGSDTLVVYLIPTMPVDGSTLTLDGQGGADDYVVYAHGSAVPDVHYVVNLFDSGAPGDGADSAEVYGADSAADGLDPLTGQPYPTDDLFLLRGTSYVPGESAFRPDLYCGTSGDSVCTNHPAYVAVVHQDPVVTTAPPRPVAPLAADDIAALARTNGYAGVTERINYDGALNGRLAVMSRGGNDVFAVDDTAAVTTLDAGAGDDTVLVGQVYGTRRDATYSGLDPPDWFPTFATTRGYLSRGASAPLLVQGGDGNDTFVVADSQSTLRLEGGEGNDTFSIAAYALAQTGRTGTEATGPLFTGRVTLDSATSTITRSAGSFLSDGFAVGQTLVLRGAGVGNDSGGTPYVIAGVTATTITLSRTLTTVTPLRVSGTFTVSFGSGAVTRSDLDVVSDPNTGTTTLTRGDGKSFVSDGFVVGQGVVLRGTDAGFTDDNTGAVPYVVLDVTDASLTLGALLTDGTFEDLTVAVSLPLPSLTATGRAQYVLDGPMSVDGGAGANSLDVYGTELGDHLVVDETSLHGAGLDVSHAHLQGLQLDTLQGNDTVDVLATAPDVVTRVLAGLGSDVVNVAGDVVGDVVGRDATGTGATVNHLVSSADVDYADVVAPGIDLSVARATQGNVVVTESAGTSELWASANGSLIGAVDSYAVSLAVAPTADVWVTVSAAASPLGSRPTSGPTADTVYLCTVSAAACLFSDAYLHTVYVDGVAGAVANRSLVLHFTAADWNVAQTVWFGAVNGTLAQPELVTTISGSVASADSRFAGAVVRNVEVTEHDALTPDIVLVQRGPLGTVDGTTAVIEGTTTTAQTDTVDVRLATLPTGPVTIAVTLSDRRVALSSNDTRFTLGAVRDGVQTYLLAFDAADWETYLTVTVGAVDDMVRQDLHHTTLVWSVESTDPARDEAYDGVTRSTDVRVVDDDTPGVYTAPINPASGRVVVGSAASGVTGGYTIRLTKAPRASVTVAIVTDGQSVVDTSACATTRVCAVGLAVSVTFDATNWWLPVTVLLRASTTLPPPSAAELTPSATRLHLLSTVRGALTLDGGTGDDLDLPVTLPTPAGTGAVLAPGESTQVNPGTGVQPSEARQVDLLSLFDDGSRADQSGVLAATSVSGLEVGHALVYGNADGTSRFELLDLLLGQGNDTLRIQSTLTPGADTAGDDRAPTGIPALYGGLTLVQGGGNSLIQVSGSFAVSSDGAGGGAVTRADRATWASAGFAVGARVNLPGYQYGVFTIVGFSADGTTMRLSGPGLLADPALLGTVSVFDLYSPDTTYARVGGDHVVVLGGGGPSAPLVVFGDTSQDGSWYAANPSLPSGLDLGSPPTVDPPGNARAVVVPIGQSFHYSGNDFLDAAPLFAGLASTTPTSLPTIGVTFYGGPGSDTLVGSQTGDVLAGGGGDDLILGERGRDIVYGDNGLNIDLLARTVITAVVAGPVLLDGAGDPVLDANGDPVLDLLPDADPMTAGHDVLIGEGLGSAASWAVGHSDDGDVIIGDLGLVVQDVQTDRTWAFDVATQRFEPGDALRLQNVQTTGDLTLVTTVEQANGRGDTLEGDLGNDLLLGGGGSDTIWGNSGNDLAFGDFGLVACTPIGTASSGCRIDLTLLPLNVPLNDHTFSWTSLDNGKTANWGNDLLNGNVGDDILIGGAGSDRITGGFGDDDLVGGSTGTAFRGLAASGGAGAWNGGVDYSAGVVYGDDWDATGGLAAPRSTCTTTADCTFGDYLDGGAGNDVLTGDNATILRTGTTFGPRFRVLTGTSMMNPATGSANTAGGDFDGTLLPCEWMDPSGRVSTACATYGYEQDPRGATARFVQLFDQNIDPVGTIDHTLPADPIAPVLPAPTNPYSDSDLAGGAGDDVLFGQLGDDWLQGDGSVIDDLGQVTLDVQTRDTVLDKRTSVEDLAGTGTDGNDYIEGNGGDDTIWGGLGQDDLVGGSSSMFGLVTPAQRPNGRDTIYGGAGTRTGINDPGDQRPGGHAADADAILGDNGNLYRLVGANGTTGQDANSYPKPWNWFLAFTYDSYPGQQGAVRIVPRAWTLLDYTPGMPTAADQGQADLIHGESGDDLILGEVGDDVLFGDGQDDTVIGGTGNDRIYGGTGEDSILGDDGFFATSRNGWVERLWGVDTPYKTDVVVTLCSLCTVATLFPKGALFHEAKLFAYAAGDVAGGGFADIIWGGTGDDWIHGNAGDDAISGAEALPVYFSDIGQDQIQAAWGLDPVDPLGYDPVTRAFADLNVGDPRSKIYDCTDGTKDVGIDAACPSGQKIDFLLNFTAYAINPDGSLIPDATGAPVKSNDGCDMIFGDSGNDWLVGGTNTNWLFGGLGDDLLQTTQNLDVDGGHNQHPEPASFAEPTFAYGGAGKDVLIAGTGKARLFDWTGDNDLFVVPFGWGGAPTVNRFYTPQIAAFILALARAAGADQALATLAPDDETGLTRPGGPLWASQQGTRAIPVISIIAGQRLDFLGFVDLAGSCNRGCGTSATRAIAHCICSRPYVRAKVRPCPLTRYVIIHRIAKPCPPPVHRVTHPVRHTVPPPARRLPPCYALVPRNLRPLTM